MEPIARTRETATPHDQSSECRWWSARRAAAYIGAGPKEIYKAVRAGKLKAVRLNQRGDIRTTREWVDEWMEQKQREQRVM
jgi:excisionase family DNA binding protein